MKDSHKPQGYVPKRRLRKLDFRGTDFEGLEVTVTTSFPMGLLNEFESGDFDRIMAALLDIVVDWNLCDMRTGESLGPPDVDNIKRVPKDVLEAMLETALAQVKGGGIDPNAAASSGDN